MYRHLFPAAVQGKIKPLREIMEHVFRQKKQLGHRMTATVCLKTGRTPKSHVSYVSYSNGEWQTVFGTAQQKWSPSQISQ
jgi:hypothetical protein